MKKNMFAYVMGFIGTAMLSAGLFICHWTSSLMGLCYLLVALGGLVLLFASWKRRKTSSWDSFFGSIMLIAIVLMNILSNSWRIVHSAMQCLVMIIALMGIIKMLTTSKKDKTKAD